MFHHRRTIFGVAGAIVGVLLLVGPALAFWVGPVSRLAGSDRYATAVAISNATFTTTPVPVAYIAIGTNFPDALAGGTAARKAGGPVLLVAPSSIPDSVKAELTRLQPANIKVLGGPSVIPDSEVSELGAFTAGSVTRLAGADRYATAAAIVQDGFAGYSGPVFVAYGGNFPDALSGGAAAAAAGAPIVLATTNGIPDPIVGALATMTPSQFVLLGGASVLGTGVVNRLAQLYPGVPVARWSGSDRYATSAAIAAHAFPSGASKVFLATGLNFPDALAGVPAAGLANAPLLLTQRTCLPPVAFVELQQLNPASVVLLGGSSVVAASAPTTVCGPAPQPAETVDCSDFATHKAAQAWFNYYRPWFGDIAKLDGNNDGVACESLP
jgi:putative cell wall-binding protein